MKFVLDDSEAGVKLVTGSHQGRLGLARLLLCSTAEKHLYGKQYLGSAILTELLQDNKVCCFLFRR